jgi:chromosome partitioning protein
MSQYIVSARKYRPDSFGTLIGQDNISQTLKNSILRGQLAHAYLFCGPRGVGKTTTAINLAASLAVLEKKVLIIDADPQANTTSGLNFSPEDDQKRTLYEVMIGKIDISDALIQTEIALMHMIPSHINLVGAEIEMLEDGNRESILKNALASIRDEYDYIIIDCSPSLGLITVNSLTAADSVMIPVQPEFFALEGLGKLLQTIRLVQGGPNPDLTIEGFVVTMFDGRTKVHNQVLGELKEHFKDMVFDTIIQRNIRLSEAPSHGKPIILYDVICNGTTNYLNLAKEVLEKNAR